MTTLLCSLRLSDSYYLNKILRSEGIRGPWSSYKADTVLLPLQSTPEKYATIQHAINSVDNVVDLVGVDGQSIDKSSWTIDHHCACLLLFWSESLTGPGGPLEMFKTATPEKKDYYSILFHFFTRVRIKKPVVPNLLSTEPGVEILWQWPFAPGEPQNEASRDVKTLTFNEAKRTVDDIFNLTSGGYKLWTFYHVKTGRQAYDEHGWVRLVHRLSRDVRCTTSRQVTIEVHTIGPGFWMSPSADPEVAVEDMEFYTFDDTFDEDNV
jgi:hypothetical protein